jgi:peptide deformylase
MAILQVVKYPAAILKTKTDAVAEVNDEIRKIVDDMIETMYADNGMGLAANQVGINKRIFVMDDSEKMDQPLCYINPEVVEARGEVELTEGCLSFPGVYVKIIRPDYVKVKALDRNGKEFYKESVGYGAHCILHEIDHLDGITFIDKLSPLKRSMAEKKLAKAKRVTL